MAVSVEVVGRRRLAEVAKALKGVGGKELKAELRKGLRNAAKPLGGKAKAGLGQYMPSGYTPVLKRAFRVTVRIGLSGNPSVTLVGKAKGRRKMREIKALDAGVLRHPVFGNRQVWVAQKIQPGFWSDPMRAGGPEVREQILGVIADVNAKIASKNR